MSVPGLPDTVVFRPKTPAVVASKVRQNFLPINGREFSPGNQIHFSLACGKRGAFIDPKATYLKFTLENTSANGLILDASAHSVFHLLEVYYGSTQLEYIREYAPLLSMLMDSQASTDREFKNGNVLEGMSTTGSRTGITIATTTSKTFCVPLVSGLIGSLAEKMLPVGAMTRDNLKVSLTLADNLNIQVTAGNEATWKVEDVELICEYVHIDDMVARVIEQENSGGYNIPFTSFSLQSNSIAAGLGSANILLSGNFTSVKTIFSIFRLQANRDDKAKKFITGRVNPIQDTGYWSYDIAGMKVPQQRVLGSVETFMELQKAFHNFSSVEGHGIHTSSLWTNADAGSFIIAVDLDHFGGKTAFASTGTNISTSSCYLQVNFSTATAAALLCDTWFHFDAVLTILPDGSAAQTRT